MSYFLKVTEPEQGSDQLQKSYKIHEGTLQNLREQGCTDEELFESIAVAALFNFMDRMADALGAPVEGFQEMMKQMQETSS